jgi:hypothetical protein
VGGAMLVTVEGVVSLFIIRVRAGSVLIVLEGVLWNWLIIGIRKEGSVRESLKVEKCPRCESKGSLHVKWVLNKIKKKYEPYYGVAHYNRETKRLRWCYVNRKIAIQLIHDSFPNT